MNVYVKKKQIDISQIARIAIQNDAIDTINFYLPKTYEGVDLTTFSWYLVYEYPDKTGGTLLLDTSVGSDYIEAEKSLIETAITGNLKIQLLAVNEYQRFQTDPTSITIRPTLNPSSLTDVTIWEEYLTIYQAILLETERLGDKILLDAGFIAVSNDLLGYNTIGQVASDLTDVGIVAGISTDVSNVSAIKDDVSDVSLIKDDVSVVAVVATDIGIVATDLALGIASKIKIVSDSIADVTTVAGIQTQVTALGALVDEMVALYAIRADITEVSLIDDAVSALALLTTQITALGARTAEIDALYAEIDQIATKATVASVDAAKGTGWTDENLVDHEDRLNILEADDTTAGSVAKTVKDTAQDATYDNTGTGIEAVTLQTAITELDARLVDAEAHVYGFDFNETTGVCTRLLDAVGLTVGAPDGVNPIVSDFDSCYPWSAMHHVKIALDGTRKEPFEDGYDTFDGEIMRHTPAYWYKDYRSGGHRYLYISDKKKAGFLYQKAYDIASFDASKVGTSYRSRVGEAPKTNESYTQFITGFYAQGDGKWSMYDQLHSEFMLSVIEAGTMNHKGAYGRGINSGMPYSSSASYNLTAPTVDGNELILADAGQPFYAGMTIQVGTTYNNNSIAQDRIITDVDRIGGVLTITVDGAPFSAPVGSSVVSWGQSVPQNQFDTMGDGSGYILQHESVNRSHVCYRGVWDLWGNVWQFYAGFMRYNGRYYGCTDPTKYNITNPVGADGWVDLGVGEYAENGYQQIREGVVIDGGTIDVPVTWGSVANSETYYSAYLYNFSSAYPGARVLRLGGGWNAGGDVSLVCSYGNGSPSSADVDFGSRLIRS